MKIGIEVKNPKPAIKPTKNDVIIFDGKEWYVTTKDDLFREYQEKVGAELEKVDEKLDEVSQELKEIKAFKKEISEQIIEMSNIIRNFLKSQEE